MEPSLSFENVLMPSELNFESFEQGVECDGILPDYLPDISRVIRCTLEPRVLNRQWLGDSLELDGEIRVRMVYFSEESGALAVYETLISFSKSLEGRVSSPEAVTEVLPRVDYCHCRVVNRRKAEIRGAVSFSVRAAGGREEKLLTDAGGCGLECHRTAKEISVLQAAVSQQSEEQADFVLEGEEQEIRCILDARGICILEDQRAADGQLLVRGAIRVRILAQKTDGAVCSIQREIPFSRVLEQEKLTDGIPCVVRTQLVRLDTDLPESEDEPLLSVSAELWIGAVQPVTRSVSLIDDCYSTLYESEQTEVHLKMPVLTESISESGSVTDRIHWGEEKPDRIFEVFGALDRLSVTPKFGDLTLQGNMIYTVYYQRQDGMPAVTERTVPFEIVRKLASSGEEMRFDGSLQLTEITAGSFDADGMEIHAGMKLNGAVYILNSCEAVSDIQVMEEQPKAPETDGLILYFGERGEEIWQIGKRYGLSVSRIMEENRLDEETLKDSQLLLIPAV